MSGNEKGKKVNGLNDALKRFGWCTRIENLVCSSKIKFFSIILLPFAFVPNSFFKYIKYELK